MFAPGTRSNFARNRPFSVALLHANCDLQFDAALEAEYARTHLINSRMLILVTCVVAASLAALRSIEPIASGGWDLIDPFFLLFVIASSIGLLAIAASSAFERWYLPVGRIVVPLRNIIVAAQITSAASQGQLDLLIILPLALIGPFFFLGFNFRVGFLCGVLTTASFIVSAFAVDLAPAVILRASAFLLMSLAACTVIARHVEKWSRAAFLETRRNADLAQHDALTGTKNRRVFDEHLIELWPRAIEQGKALAVLLIDVDRFKAFNDRYGHQAGDHALRCVVEAIETFATRPHDVLARYGGEEFAAVLYDLDHGQALHVAERMRRAVEALDIAHQGSEFDRVTISVGVAAIKPTGDRNVQGVLQLADQALYAAKIRGRNRTEAMSDVEHRMLETGVFSRSLEATPEKSLPNSLLSAEDCKPGVHG
jgi:diguanylate cyclase (GGDEF)-like protein